VKGRRRQSWCKAKTARRTHLAAPMLVVACLFSVSATRLRLFEISDAATKQRAGPASQDALTVKNASFHSASLSRDVEYRIYLPRNYEQGSQSFPVLYLLHGFYGNFTDWDKQSHLRKFAENLDFIIVMPDGDNSWYVNSMSDSRNSYEDFIVKDLIGEVDGHYRTVASRKSRAIAGDSMGGYGALNLALRHPELFAFAGSLSGALNAPSDLGPRQPAFQASLTAAFGEQGSAARNDNDVFTLLKRADISRLPYIYVACGESDVFVDLNRQFAALLEEWHARYEAHFTPGGHDWKYWNGAIREMLPVLARSIDAGPR
jgi:putative tributyrin esterase